MSKHDKHQNVTSLPDVVQEEELQEQEEGGKITERFFGKDYIKVNTFAEVAKYTHNGNTTSVSALFNLYKDKDTVDGLFEPKHYITLRKDDEDTQEFFERYPDVPRSTKYLLTEAGFIALCSHSRSEQSRQVIAATADKAIMTMNLDIQAKSTDSMLKFFADLFSTNSNLNIEPFAKTFEILAENQKYEMETIRELNMQRMAFERDVAKAKIELQLEQLKTASEKALPRYTWFKNHVDVLIVTNLNTKEQKAFESQRSCYTEYGMVPAQLRKIVEEHRPWQVKKGSHEGEAIQIEKKLLSEYYTSELYKQAAENN
jgi:hypothetical protein